MGVMEMCRSNIRLILAGLGLVLSSAAAADTPAPPAAPAAPPASMPAGPASAVAPPANTPTAAPSNQIWECTTNGVRTFSSNPCGTKSTVRQLNPINVMEPAPVYRAATNYAPTMVSPPAPVRYSYPDQDNADEPSTDNAYGGDPGVIVVPRARHVRPNNVRPHPPHPHPHPHPHPP
jgi:hypothetical protein